LVIHEDEIKVRMLNLSIFPYPLVCGIPIRDYENFLHFRKHSQLPMQLWQRPSHHLLSLLNQSRQNSHSNQPRLNLQHNQIHLQQHNPRNPNALQKQHQLHQHQAFFAITVMAGLK
jgi:hypothetical protein